ncbi:hypothetical protein ATANTOWER_029248 [Ataeniobius toweri]|uniref:C-type lectin domain-containing protein n=1 Tax=Ataeniobius toweri TaxID=208326 RepID=A0ABU7C429_9TELE|nr:hypothetical protein [Ataeniobius toweri]
MKSSLLGHLVLLALSSILVSGSKYYIHIKWGLTWEEALDFCKRHYTDLATISYESEANSMDLKQYQVWSGLKKDKEFYNGWRWSDGKFYAPDWATNEPNKGSCATVNFKNKKLYAKSCDTHRMFVCWNVTGYTFVKEAKTWNDASNYCRNYHGNLASFRSNDMNKIFTQQDFPLWVGMRREAGGSFTWISGYSEYKNWKTGEPSNMGNCTTISSVTKLMATEDCRVRLPFVCTQEGNINVILVKESKSWEEALEHCRGLNSSDFGFDLISVQPGDEQENIMNKVMEADTKEVWTGQRFLGDDWLWVDGENMLNTSLNQCPMQEQHCGALPKNYTGSIEAKDCSERKNFLCYRFPL